MEPLLLIGCGDHSFRTIGPALNALKHDILGVCDTVQERAHAFAAKFAPLATIYSDIQSIPQQSYKIVIAATGPSGHASAAERFGKNSVLFLEKPPCRSAEEASYLARGTHEPGASVHVGFNFRFAPAIVRLKALLPHRDEIAAVVATFYSRHPLAPKFDIESFEETWWITNGIHVLDTILYLFGEPSQVTNFQRTFNQHFLCSTALFEYDERSLIVTINSGNVTPEFDFSIDVRLRTGRLIRMSNLRTILVTAGARDSPAHERRQETVWLEEPGTLKMISRGHYAELQALLDENMRMSGTLASLADGAAALHACASLLAATNASEKPPKGNSRCDD